MTTATIKHDQATKGTTAMNLSARLDKLERTDGAGPVIVIWQNHDETDDVAIARWCAAHPDEPTPDPNSSHVCLIRWEAPQ